MREILFRAKSIENGEWVYGDYRMYSMQALIVESGKKQNHRKPKRMDR